MFTKPSERIKFFRGLKGWTQEDMADKLKMSVTGYGNIERGDTNVTLSRLGEIAKVLGIELQELFNSQGKIVINLGETSALVNGDNYGESTCQKITNVQKELEHELEKSHLIIGQQAKEISLLHDEIEHLKEIISLLKK